MENSTDRQSGDLTNLIRSEARGKEERTGTRLYTMTSLTRAGNYTFLGSTSPSLQFPKHIFYLSSDCEGRQLYSKP